MNQKYDKKYPKMFNIYWAFKYACGISREGYEYCDLNMYFDLISAGDRSVPYWMTNRIPTETMMPGLIPCSATINERKNDLKHRIAIYEFPESFPVHTEADRFKFKQEQCKMIDWLIENCSGEWYLKEFAGTIAVRFTKESDALGFRLAWE